MDKAASDAVKTEIFDPTLLANTRSYAGMFDIEPHRNEAVDDQSLAIEIKQEKIDYAPDENHEGMYDFSFLSFVRFGKFQFCNFRVKVPS